MKLTPVFALVLALLSLISWPQFATAETKPNVVLFLVDDMGWMDSSVYGSEYYETPNMERLAKQAMRFTDAYAVPLCSPSRASILTGQYSARHGVTSASGHTPARPEEEKYPKAANPSNPFIYPYSKNYLDPSLVTIAEALQGAGYRTGHFGKWHLGLMQEHWPETQGFEETWHCAPDPGPPSYFSPYGVVPEGRPTGKQHVGNITDGPEGEYITDRLTDEALKFVEAHKDEPFFLNLWQYGVHGPWGHKLEYTEYFAKKEDPRGQQRNPIMASMLKSVDDSLGRVLDKLEELGIAENTLLIFYSDNGGNFHSNTPDSRQMQIPETHPKYPQVLDWKKWAGPEPPTNNFPLREGKGRIYEGGQRVPLMVSWPGHIEGGTTSDALVTAIDLFPTILDALNLQQPADHVIDGISFLPVLEQEGELKRDALFTWFPHLIPAASVRVGDYKLIRRWEPHPEYPEIYELYNVEDDISEATNLADKMPEKVKELETVMDAFIADTGALVPKPNPAYKPALAKNTTERDPAFGLVPKLCKLSPVNGAMKVTADADRRKPFLGTAQVKFNGPLKLDLRARSEKGGTGQVMWKTANQEEFPSDQVVEFTLKAGSDWQDLSVDVPVNGKVGIARLYLPAEDSPVEVQSIKFAGNGGARVWDFSKVKAE